VGGWSGHLVPFGGLFDATEDAGPGGLFPASAAEDESRDVHSREFQLCVSHVTERLRGMKLTGAGTLENRIP